MKRKGLLLFTCLAIIGYASAQAVAKYPLDGNAKNSLGTNYYGLVYGATASADRFGTASKAYKFGGVSDYISVPNFPALGSSYTIMAWVKVASLPAGRIEILSLGSTQRAQGLYIYLQNNNIYTDLSIVRGPVAIAKLAAGEWTHIAVTASLSLLTVYVNGSVAAQLNVPFAADIRQGPLEIGRAIYNNKNYFQGDIDEVGIYKGAMTPAQINAFYIAQPIISGASAIECQSGTGWQYTVKNAGATSIYKWLLNGVPLSATGKIITVNFKSEGTNTLSVYRDSNTVATNFAILFHPKPEFTIMGPDWVKPGETGVRYWINNSYTPGHSYSWTCNGGSIAYNYGTSIIVNWGTSNSKTEYGEIKRTESTGYCTTANSRSVTISMYPPLSSMNPNAIQSESVELTEMKIVPAGLYTYKVLVPGNATINVMDITGRIVQSLKVNRSALLDLSSRSSGIYIIQNTSSKEKSIRLVR